MRALLFTLLLATLSFAQTGWDSEAVDQELVAARAMNKALRQKMVGMSEGDLDTEDWDGMNAYMEELDIGAKPGTKRKSRKHKWDKKKEAALLKHPDTNGVNDYDYEEQDGALDGVADGKQDDLIAEYDWSPTEAALAVFTDPRTKDILSATEDDTEIAIQQSQEMQDFNKHLDDLVEHARARERKLKRNQVMISASRGSEASEAKLFSRPHILLGLTSVAVFLALVRAVQVRMPKVHKPQGPVPMYLAIDDEV